MSARFTWPAGGAALLPLAAAALLAGCGRAEPAGNSRGQLDAASADQKFGPAFGELSREAPESKPRDLSQVDLPPVDPTASPVDF